jgi:hypothetical protein
MLTSKTKRRLINALTRKKLADELEAALIASAPLSSKLKRAIEVALASKKAALDLIAAVETAGAQVLKLDTKRRIIQELSNKAAGNEVISQAEASN